MKILPVLAFSAALLVSGCTNTDRLISKIKDGTHPADKGVILANVTVIDQYSKREPGVLSICINKESEAQVTPIKCESVSNTVKKDVEAQKKNQLMVETSRKSFGIDAFVYTYADKKGLVKNKVQLMFVNNTPRAMLDNYGDMAYAGDFVFTIVENPEKETPEIRISYSDDYENTKRILTDAATKGGAAANSKFFKMQNKGLSGFMNPQDISYKETVINHPTTTYYYIPTYKPR